MEDFPSNPDRGRSEREELLDAFRLEIKNMKEDGRSVVAPLLQEVDASKLTDRDRVAWTRLRGLAGPEDPRASMVIDDVTAYHSELKGIYDLMVKQGRDPSEVMNSRKFIHALNILHTIENLNKPAA